MLWLALIGVAAILILMPFLALGLLLPVSATPKQTAADQYISIFGSQIRYRPVARSGTTVIFLHGFGNSLAMWEPLTKFLSCGRIFTLDLIGFGGSDRPGITYDLETLRRYLVAFMDAQHIDRAVLVGSSMGASIAAWTAAHSPDRVLAVVLFAPSGYPGSLQYPWPLGTLYRPGIPNRLARMIVQTWIFEILFPHSLARQALGITSSYNSLFAEVLFRIHQPTLLVWSRGDRKVPFLYSEVYRKRIPHAKLIERPAAAGHGVATFAPQETAEQICKFLNEFSY
jgi:pimeloyl-ACP methyl ester carboxylesterase